MKSQEVVDAIRAGRRTPSLDPELDTALLHEIVAIEDSQTRIIRLEQAIDASREVDGWNSDILISARPYIVLGILPPTP